jgi:hypothetical protein
MLVDVLGKNTDLSRLIVFWSKYVSYLYMLLCSTLEDRTFHLHNKSELNKLQEFNSYFIIEYVIRTGLSSSMITFEN